MQYRGFRSSITTLGKVTYKPLGRKRPVSAARGAVRDVTQA